MAADQPVQDNLAVVFLVESSLQVAREWRKRVLDYFAALMKRLIDCHPNSKSKVVFVCYGPGDHEPSPILCKRFFADHHSFFKEMSESDISRLGVGMTNSGGTRGMAALEGFVAMLEVVDILQTAFHQTNNASTPTFHVVHVAASSPDSSSRPLWNEQASLDTVGWETLPEEIKKRNVNLTSINLKHGLTHFSKLSSSVVSAGSSPWFSVHNPHTLFLAAFPTPPQTKVTPTKRPVEPPVERVVETKRPRLQPTTESPKPAPKTTTPQVQPSVPPQLPVQPAPRPVIPPVPSQTPSQIINLLASGKMSQQVFMEKMKGVEIDIKNLKQQILAAQASGNKQMEESLRKLHQSKSIAFANVAQHYRLLLQSKAQQQGNNIMQNPGYSLSTGNLPSTSSGPSIPQEVVTNPSQMQHVRSMSDANFPMNPNPTMMGNPNLNSQMQKMIEQTQRGRPPHPTMGQGHVGNTMNNIGPSTGLPNRLNPGNVSGQPPPQPDQHPQSTKNKMVWKGTLHWSGTNPLGGKKDMQALVGAINTNDTPCHAETWPPELTLAPIPATSDSEMTEWIRRHLSQLALCTFIVPSSTTTSGRGNEVTFSSLITLLLEKKLYATAAWTTPSGVQTKNALIFPMSGKLHGAFFPLTGLPSNLPTSMPDMHARFMQQIQTLPRDAQAAFFNKFAQAGMVPQQQQQPSRSQEHNNGPPFPPNLLFAHNMMNAQAQNGAMMNVNGQQPSFPPSLPRAGMNNNPVPNNVSLAMLQSFVQRNDGGTNLNPQG